MMEPNLIRKFKGYFAEFKKKKNPFDKNQNDTGIDYVDLRSNDLWCLTYLILITFDFKFASCYTFNPTNEDSLIAFNVKLFIEVYKSFCEKFAHDANLIYVMNSLLGIGRFSEGESQANPRIPGTTGPAQQNHVQQLDLLHLVAQQNQNRKQGKNRKNGKNAKPQNQRHCGCFRFD